jgi:hypothetical protein
MMKYKLINVRFIIGVAFLLFTAYAWNILVVGGEKIDSALYRSDIAGRNCRLIVWYSQPRQLVAIKPKINNYRSDGMLTLSTTESDVFALTVFLGLQESLSEPLVIAAFPMYGLREHIKDSLNVFASSERNGVVSLVVSIECTLYLWQVNWRSGRSSWIEMPPNWNAHAVLGLVKKDDVEVTLEYSSDGRIIVKTKQSVGGQSCRFEIDGENGVSFDIVDVKGPRLR